jgi:hypothetical protein
VPDHLGFVGILEDLQQGGNGVRREQLAEDKCNFMPVSETMSKIWNATAWSNTNLKSALSSAKPAASASTADDVPMFRRANIAR